MKSIIEDSQGKIWFGAQGGGLSRHDRQTGSFTHFLHNPNNSSSISHNNVWMIAEDHSHDLWIATNNGLNKFERKTERFIRYFHDPENLNSLSSNIIRSVLVDGKNRVWIGTQNSGISRFNQDNDRFHHYSLKGAHLIALFGDRNKRIWVGGVAGSNNDGMWNSDGISVKLTVLPPWWESRWFFALCGMVTLGLLGFIYHSKSIQREVLLKL